jgi:acyl carrier protein
MDRAVFDIIVQTVSGILSERGDSLPELKPETPIFESGLDSLDIADLTLQLDKEIGRVPEEALRRYPHTIGELAELYARYQLQPVSEVLQTGPLPNNALNSIPLGKLQ